MRLFYCLHIGFPAAKPAVVDVFIDITPFLVSAQMTMECLKSREICPCFEDFADMTILLTILLFSRTMQFIN
jgi:hypothetical protein